MDNSANRSGMGVSAWEPKYPFDLVILYEDIATRNQALRLYDRLAQRLLADHDFQCGWWKIEHLGNGILFERALDAAAEANMVVLSLRESDTLPAGLNRWLDTLPSRKDDRQSALVGLICGGKRGQQTPAVYALQRVALAAGMDFFCNTLEPPRDTEDLSFAQIDTRVHSMTPLLEEILHRPSTPSHWGLNE